MEDKELKKRLKRIPDVDENGDPIYKIDTIKNEPKKESGKSNKNGSRTK
jgi:predicted phage tail protein